jgi:hypothetical protein
MESLEAQVKLKKCGVVGRGGGKGRSRSRSRRFWKYLCLHIEKFVFAPFLGTNFFLLFCLNAKFL